MRWAAAVSSQASTSEALAELAQAIEAQLDGARPDLLLAFVSQEYDDQCEQIPQLVAAQLNPRVFIGCTGVGIIGGGREVEDKPALALIAATLPGVEISGFHLSDDDLPDLDAGPQAWIEALGVAADQPTHFVLLADPVGPPGFDAQPLLMGLDFAYGSGTKIGGNASVIAGNWLFLDGVAHRFGAVGVALQGNLEIDTVVAQGCRAIGKPMRITDCHEHYLLEVDGRPVIDVLVELYRSMAAEEQELMRYLQLGLASTELQAAFEPGDFLIRSVVQIDQEKGYIAVAGRLREGQTVQFHVRDAETAAEDLAALLARYQRRPQTRAPAGALLFTCTGRGQGLYGRSDHDSDLFAEAVGPMPLAGFFCGGEIGPVGDSTYIHGYTSAFGIFRPVD
ncbi:MAG: hypothetical protein GKR89_02905 [Candidatus Latescibacteria bacterium]|nr:hypothetical protein [Candidatus Latescibacterota bacterium]